MGLLKNVTSGVYENKTTNNVIKTPENISNLSTKANETINLDSQKILIPKKTGLLNKISTDLSTTDLNSNFYYFIINNKISNFAILNPINNHYFITNSLGFDSKSIFQSYSTLDFWNGLIPEEETIYCFSNDKSTLNPLLQFFSLDLKESINYISVIKFDKTICLLCSYDAISITNTMLPEIYSFIACKSDLSDSTIKENQNETTRLSFDYSTALKDYVISTIRNKFYLKNFYTKAISLELQNRFLFYFHKELINYQIKDDKIIFEINGKHTVELIKKHLISSLLDLFETETYKINLAACQ